MLSVAAIIGVFAVRKLNKTGIDLIKEFEGFSSTVYLDKAGLPTIGYGHLIKEGETFTEITMQQAEEILKRDVLEAENTVNRLVKVKLTQNMFNSLTSFVFNVGSGAFASSTLLRKLNTGDVEGAAGELLRWKYVTVNGQKKESNGLLARRETEQRLFLS